MRQFHAVLVLVRFVNMAPSKYMKGKGVTDIVKGGKLIKKRKIFSLEAGVEVRDVGKLYSINESTVRKCKDATTNAVLEVSPRARCSAAVDDGGH
ncbi:hypothetical protein E2C01_100243 [Portunus trituberculatus]|uniref:HTH psq-type domain-containing protein n=1 Tax=Portunus trituberculatus TaxID=210409 RepID=A0A5B7KHG3_PORTR|nr:hypothetical protein [Portunus trituberculatus]